MGWASGSYLAEDIWQSVKNHLPEEKKKEIAQKIYNIFCDQDADDWCDQDLYITLFPFNCEGCGSRLEKPGKCKYCKEE
jgi:hypothetical protein